MLSIPKNGGFLSRCADLLNREVSSFLPSLANSTGLVMPIEATQDVVARTQSATLPESAADRIIPEPIFTIAVCGEEEVPRYHQAGITDILTCVSPERPVFRPSWPTIRKHLIVRCDDVEEPLQNYTYPTEDHVREIIQFGREVLHRSQGGTRVRVLVHCAAGISRSTAATLLILSMKYGEGAEKAAFNHLRGIRPQCRPNAAIVEHGDRLLGRDGRLVREVTNWKAQLYADGHAH